MSAIREPIEEKMSVRREQADAAQVSALIESFAWSWTGAADLPSPFGGTDHRLVQRAPVGAPRARFEFLDGGSHDFALGLSATLRQQGRHPRLMVHFDLSRNGAPSYRHTIVACDAGTFDIQGAGARERREEDAAKSRGGSAAVQDIVDRAGLARAIASGRPVPGLWLACEPTSADLESGLRLAGVDVRLHATVAHAVARQLVAASRPEQLWRAVECERIERAVAEFARSREPGVPWWKSAFLRDARVLFAAALLEALGGDAKIAFLYRPALQGALGQPGRGSFVHAVVDARGQVWDIGGSGALARSEDHFSLGHLPSSLQVHRPPSFKLVDPRATGGESTSTVHDKVRLIAQDLRRRLGGTSAQAPTEQLEFA